MHCENGISIGLSLKNENTGEPKKGEHTSFDLLRRNPDKHIETIHCSYFQFEFEIG
jgi:hypothetical protein